MANIIITGANQGIGYYMTEKLLIDGNKVSVLDIETDSFEKFKKQYSNSLIYHKVDLRSYDEVKTAVDKTAAEFGTFDIAVHNACKCTFESEADTDFDTYKDVFEVNYFGALRFVKSVVPYMSMQKKGKVIFTSSAVGVTGFVNISPTVRQRVRWRHWQNVCGLNMQRITSLFTLCTRLLQERNPPRRFLYLMNLRHCPRRLDTNLQSISIQSVLLFVTALIRKCRL